MVDEYSIKDGLWLHYSCKLLLLLCSSPSVIQSLPALHINVLLPSPSLSLRSEKRGHRDGVKQTPFTETWLNESDYDLDTTGFCSPFRSDKCATVTNKVLGGLFVSLFLTLCQQLRLYHGNKSKLNFKSLGKKLSK